MIAKREIWPKLARLRVAHAHRHQLEWPVDIHAKSPAPDRHELHEGKTLRESTPQQDQACIEIIPDRGKLQPRVEPQLLLRELSAPAVAAGLEQLEQQAPRQ